VTFWKITCWPAALQFNSGLSGSGGEAPRLFPPYQRQPRADRAGNPVRWRLAAERMPEYRRTDGTALA
jgi:hypothetical protein